MATIFPHADAEVRQAKLDDGLFNAVFGMFAQPFRSIGVNDIISQLPEREISPNPEILPKVLSNIDEVVITKSGITTYGTDHMVCLCLTDGARQLLCQLSFTANAGALKDFIAQEFLSRVANGVEPQVTIVLGRDFEAAAFKIAYSVLQDLNLDGKLHLVKGIRTLDIVTMTEQGTLSCGCMFEISMSDLTAKLRQIQKPGSVAGLND